MRFATAGKWRFIDKSPDVVVTLKQSGSELQLLIVEIRLHVGYLQISTNAIQGRRGHIGVL